MKSFYKFTLKLAVIAITFPMISCLFGLRSGTRIQDLLPRETDVPGWAQQNGNFFRSAKSIRKLNGNYAICNVKAVALADYYSISAPEDVINVRVIKCETTLDSFGLFTLEKGFSTVRYEKDDSYYSDNGLYFRKGDYYVRLETKNIEDIKKGDLSQFREIIDNLLDPIYIKDELPGWIHVFSQSKNLTDVVLYKNGSPLLPGVKNLIVRKRIAQDKIIFIFFSRINGDKNGSDLIYTIVNADNEFVVSKTGSIQYFYKENPEGGYILMSNKGQWLYGVLNAETAVIGTRILNTLNSELGGL